jgi:hypothetical protein
LAITATPWAALAENDGRQTIWKIDRRQRRQAGDIEWFHGARVAKILRFLIDTSGERA